MARMRFLIVLALIKCAATQHGGHKTVSVPIGNGMNVDINVTVGVNTGGNEQCVPEGDECCWTVGCPECCYRSFCPMPSVPPVKTYCKKSVGCKDKGEDCSVDHHCCDPLSCNIFTGKCDDAKKGPKPCITKGPCGTGSLHCCEGYRCRYGRWGSYCEKKSGTDENCTPYGQLCETSSECCPNDLARMTCHESAPGAGKRCMPDWPKCNANEGEFCTKDEDCCEKDNACVSERRRKLPTCRKKDDDCVPVGGKCSPSEHCCDSLWCDVDDVVTSTGTCGTKNKCNANEGEYCTKDEDCCEKDNACESETGSTRPTCTYKPKDCIEDGEPCHGTDDWTHECCSKSCCEGKCGTCGYTPWYKRS